MRERTAVYLYGSKARGDFDILSDSDILVIGQSTVNLKYLDNLIPGDLQQTNINFYSWEEIKKMAEYGSLFLHHLKLEGKCVYEGNDVKSSLSCILSKLGEYKYAKRDLHSFLEVIKETTLSFISKDLTIFDLSVLATVIRHCSILGCWLLKNPCFKRIEPVNYIIKKFDLHSFTIEEYNELYDYKLYIANRIDKKSIRATRYTPEKWISASKIIVNTVKGIENE